VLLVLLFAEGYFSDGVEETGEEVVGVEGVLGESHELKYFVLLDED
jgi:hypothetical protein